MRAKVKPVLAAVSESFEVAAGYALIAGGIAAVFFMDVTGRGSLWKSLGQLYETAQEGSVSPGAIRMVSVAARPAVEKKLQEDRMLAVFDDEPKTDLVAAAYQAPETANQRPAAAFTDTPADPKSGKDWKRSLKGELRNFTVYGRGEQTTTASISRSSPAPRQEPERARPAAAPGSVARAETSAASRPGIGSRMSSGALAASDTSRNIR